MPPNASGNKDDLKRIIPGDLSQFIRDSVIVFGSVSSTSVCVVQGPEIARVNEGKFTEQNMCFHSSRVLKG